MTGRTGLLAELARLLRLVDPMPPRVIADAEGAGVLARATRGCDEELVALLDTVPAVRSAGRRLRLGRPGGEAVVELELRRVGAAVRVTGLAPPRARLAIHWPAGSHDVPVDAAGYFTAEVPAGPVRLLFTGPGDVPAVSGWLDA